MIINGEKFLLGSTRTSSWCTKGSSSVPGILSRQTGTRVDTKEKSWPWISVSHLKWVKWTNTPLWTRQLCTSVHCPELTRQLEWAVGDLHPMFLDSESVFTGKELTVHAAVRTETSAFPPDLNPTQSIVSYCTSEHRFLWGTSCFSSILCLH